MIPVSNSSSSSSSSVGVRVSTLYLLHNLVLLQWRRY